jgi:alkylresorcinol/alkylpyrone synthase
MATAAPRILSLATAVPPFVYRQEEVRALAERVFDRAGGDRRLLAVFDHLSIGSRNICVPLEWFEHEHSFGEKNDLYIEHAFDLARRATSAALDHALLGPTQVDHVIFVSSTGLATPTLDARLANALGFRPDVKRTPIWGLGCAGGAAGLARAAEFARAAPESHTLMVAVELCSLAFQRDDDAKLGAVSASLFSDGAAALIVAGPSAWRAPTPLARLGRGLTIEILGTQSTLWPDSLDVMGWKVDERGLHVVMAREIPSAVSSWVRPALLGFLRQHDLGIADIAHFLIHPGGAKVLDAIALALEIPESALELSRDVLHDHGNMSSPTCLFVLRRLLDQSGFHPGEHALMTAMGPGFSAESLVLRAVAP